MWRSTSLEPDDDVTDVSLFDRLVEFVESEMSAVERDNFFRIQLPSIVHWSLQLKQLKPVQGFHYSLQQQREYMQICSWKTAWVMATIRLISPKTGTEFVLNLIQLTSIDSSWKALHFIFWVCNDRRNRLAAKSRKRPRESESSRLFVNLRPNTCSDQNKLKRISIDL